MKKRIKELDNKVTKEKSKDTDDKRGKERENLRRQQRVRLRCQKNGNKEDDIEVNKVSRCQMRRLKAKKKVKPLRNM